MFTANPISWPHIDVYTGLHGRMVINQNFPEHFWTFHQQSLGVAWLCKECFLKEVF